MLQLQHEKLRLVAVLQGDWRLVWQDYVASYSDKALPDLNIFELPRGSPALLFSQWHKNPTAARCLMHSLQLSLFSRFEVGLTVFRAIDVPGRVNYFQFTGSTGSNVAIIRQHYIGAVIVRFTDGLVIKPRLFWQLKEQISKQLQLNIKTQVDNIYLREVSEAPHYYYYYYYFFFLVLLLLLLWLLYIFINISACLNGINGHGGMNDYFKSLFSTKSEKKTS